MPQCVTWLALPHVQRLDLVVVKIASLDCGMAFTITDMSGMLAAVKGGGGFRSFLIQNSSAIFSSCLPLQ